MSEEYKARTREMIAVMQAYVDGQEIEVVITDWSMLSPMPLWNWEKQGYRIAQTPDSIDWSHVVPEWKYMARDLNGEVWFYKEKPDCWTTQWGGEPIRATSHASYKRGTVDWKDSLVVRPE